MKVREAIERLQRFDPEAEFHRVTDDSWLSESTVVDDFYESTATYGILTPNPTTVRTVVATDAFHGL